MRTRLNAARLWASQGISPIPIVRGTKRPAVDDWTRYQTQLPTDAEIEGWFRDDWYEIGVVHGPAPLVVVDFDRKHNPKISDGGFLDHAKQYPEITLLPRVRTGSGAVHLLGLAQTPFFEILFDDGKIEVRAGAHVTLTPPSRHPDGGQYRWEVEPVGALPHLDLARLGFIRPATRSGRPSTLSRMQPVILHPSALRQFIRVLRPHWIEGQRHSVALALSGWFATKAVPLEVAASIVEAVVDATSDDDGYDRLLTAVTSYARHDKGLSLLGWRWLELRLGADAMRLQSALASVMFYSVHATRAVR